MTPSIAAVGIYAGIMGLILLWLATFVGNWRRQLKISIGDGGNLDLIRAMRGQANFVEYVPLVLLLMLIAAIGGAPAIAIHGMGLPLVAARILHGLHFSKPGQPGWMRGAGAGITLLVLALGSIGLAGHGIWSLL